MEIDFRIGDVAGYGEIRVATSILNDLDIGVFDTYVGVGIIWPASVIRRTIPACDFSCDYRPVGGNRAVLNPKAAGRVHLKYGASYCGRSRKEVRVRENYAPCVVVRICEIRVFDSESLPRNGRSYEKPIGDS